MKKTIFSMLVALIVFSVISSSECFANSNDVLCKIIRAATRTGNNYTRRPCPAPIMPMPLPIQPAPMYTNIVDGSGNYIGQVSSSGRVTDSTSGYVGQVDRDFMGNIVIKK